MKPRYTLFALVLAGLTAPTVTSAQTPLPPYPGDVPCLLRMMNLSLMAGDSAKDTKRPEDSRARSAAVSADARKAVFYYLGRLGPAWLNTNHNPEAETEFAKMNALPQDKLVAEMTVCLTTATDAEQKAIVAMSAKKN